jgi:hypothetical protein
MLDVGFGGGPIILGLVAESLGIPWAFGVAAAKAVTGCFLGSGRLSTAFAAAARAESRPADGRGSVTSPRRVHDRRHLRAWRGAVRNAS